MTEVGGQRCSKWKRLRWEEDSEVDLGDGRRQTVEDELYLVEATRAVERLNGWRARERRACER